MNRAKAREAYRRWLAKNPGASRRCNLLRWYGLTVEAYDEMLAAQNGVCAICGGLPNKHRLSVDHNHVTGKVRGLLCPVCNTRLFAVEDVSWRTKAENYLKQEVTQ